MTTDYRSLINRDLPTIDRACLSKVPYGTQREARQFARRGRHATGSLSPYHCRYCGDWHLGHTRRR